jgi:uncharacterized protein YktB (UPF0637 family)
MSSAHSKASRKKSGHKTLFSESEYPIDTNDALYPNSEENNGWSVVPFKKQTLKHSQLVSANVYANVSASAAVNKRKQRAITRRLKKEKKEIIQKIVDQYKIRWSKGEPDILEEKYVTKLDKDLASFFKSGYLRYFSEGRENERDIVAFVKNTIKKYKLIISGGYVLKCISTAFTNALKPSVDVDIYVPNHIPHRYPEFYETMAKLFNCDVYTRENGSTGYKVNRFIASSKQGKSSFFNKNGIYSVYKHERNVDGLYAEMDLVRAVDGITAKSIVLNFDLSVCMNWYDGEHIYVMDLPGVTKQASGFLNYSYNTLYRESKVSRDRIYKYLTRGYRISYMNPNDGEFHEIVEDDLLNSKQRMNNMKKMKNAFNTVQEFDEEN